MEQGGGGRPHLLNRQEGAAPEAGRCDPPGASKLFGYGNPLLIQEGQGLVNILDDSHLSSPSLVPLTFERRELAAGGWLFSVFDFGQEVRATPANQNIRAALADSRNALDGGAHGPQRLYNLALVGVHSSGPSHPRYDTDSLSAKH